MRAVAGAPSPALASFHELAGAAVRYDRDSAISYGTKGRPFQFAAQPDFLRQLEKCFEEIWSVSALGSASMILSAGAYTRKPGCHGLGRAFDLDGILWHDSSFLALHDGHEGEDRYLYLGVECVLRRYFGQVLNYAYNDAHRDHLHMDDGQLVGCRPGSRALVLFLQGLLEHVHQLPVMMDGEWQEETAAGLSNVLRRLGLPDRPMETGVWMEFLLRSASLAFAQSRTGRVSG